MQPDSNRSQKKQDRQQQKVVIPCAKCGKPAHYVAFAGRESRKGSHAQPVCAMWACEEHIDYVAGLVARILQVDASQVIVDLALPVVAISCCQMCINRYEDNVLRCKHYPESIPWEIISSGWPDSGSPYTLPPPCFEPVNEAAASYARYTHLHKIAFSRPG